MDYKVLSRKYRPQKFSEIIGQPHIINTLVNSINLNRLAHGYLFSGLRGVGKTTTARVLSKTLNCSNKEKQDPCEKCKNCIEIIESRSLDVIELDGASNRGIDEIRQIKETVKYPPISSDYKIFIIDEVHMLTKEAFNALLKTLEEPPKNVVFILATTDLHKIPDTILSRTLRFDFKKITNQKLSDHMIDILNKENIEYEENALSTIASKADGSVRDSLSILDKIIAYSNKTVSYNLVRDSLGIIEDKVYLELLSHIIDSDQNALLIKLREVIDSGYSLDNFTSGFNTFLSSCLICVSGYKSNDIVNDETIEWIEKNKQNINSVDIMRIIEEMQKYELKSKYLLQPDIALESLFLKLSVMGSSVKISELLDNISIEKDLYKKQTNQIIKEKKIDSSIDSIPIVTEEKKDKVISKNEDLISEKEEDKVNPKINSILKDDLNSQWKKIVTIIDTKDKRISNSLDDAKISIDNQTIIINLGETANSYIQKTLNDNRDLIQESVFEVVNHKFDIEIIASSKYKEEEKEQDHPLLNDIKEKFNGGTIR